MNRASKNWLIIFLGLLLFGISTWLATKGELVLGEEYILNFAYGLPADLRLFFLVITLLGSAWILAIILIALLIKERYDIALRLMAASALAYLITGFAKEIISRPRPGFLIDVLHREILVFGYGFPSGHTSLATTIALIVSAYLPTKRKYIVGIWIGAVALSRLYLGVHAPLDIVGGICIGVVVAYTVLLIMPVHKNVKGIRVAKKHKQP